jgi:hypothetical protein
MLASRMIDSEVDEAPATVGGRYMALLVVRNSRWVDWGTMKNLDGSSW